MVRLAWLTNDQWSIVGALGAATQAVAALLLLVVAIVAAKYAAGQVREARAQVEEAQKARFDQAEQARALEEDAANREYQRRKELAEREEQRQQEIARPFVVVDFVPSLIWQNAIILVFENVGKTLAKNVRFTFEPPLESSQTGKPFELADSLIVTRGVPTMPPGRRIETLFDLSHERIKTALPMSYHVRVDSQDAMGRDQTPLEYDLDLAFLYDLGGFQKKTIHDAAKSLHEIERTVAKWTAHFNGLRVWVQDERTYLAEQAAEYERRKADNEGLVERMREAQLAGTPLSEMTADDSEADQTPPADSETEDPEA
jgi:hypothetical protein